MRFFHSFRFKTILGIALIEAFLLALLLYHVLSYLNESNQSLLQKRTVTTVAMFASGSADAVLSNDLAELESSVNEMVDKPDVVYARIKDTDGKVLAEKVAPELGEHHFQIDLDLSLIKDGIVDSQHAIMIDDVSYGSVEIGFDIRELQALEKDVARHSIMIALSEMLLVALFSFLLGMYLTRQLADLNKASLALADGNLSYRAPVRGKDELAVTAQAFNNMAEQLEKDVEQRQIVECNLERARDEAQAATKAKSEFLANMSHEIRTPMNGILGLSEIGLSEQDPDKMKDHLTKIHFSGRLLLDIINDILDFSKIEAGKLTIETTPFLLSNLCNDLNNLFKKMANDKGLSLNILLDAQLAEAYLGDELRIRQVLVNLVGNALKFTTQGSITLRIETVAPEGKYLRFSVTDTGIGMTQEQVSRLFHAFQQADTSITRKFGGTGLGLVISERLVALMNGEPIQVTSEQGQGSTFSFILPLTPATPEQQSKLKKPTKLSNQLNNLSGSVLVTDDNPINRQVAKALLVKMGIEVTLAENGQEAVDLVKAQSFNAVLMDVQMPVMDGYEATKHIRLFNPTIPIIALTAAAMVEDREKALEAGMNDHLSKPINAQRLHDMLAEILPLKTTTNE